MDERCATLAAEIFNWPSKAQLKCIFENDGYMVREGKYSISLGEVDQFVFRTLENDLNSGTISADHTSMKELVAFAGRVSRTLAKAKVKHRFEVYSVEGKLVAYVHHDWPKDW